MPEKNRNARSNPALLAKKSRQSVIKVVTDDLADDVRRVLKLI